jgi:hypothetical protein
MPDRIKGGSMKDESPLTPEWLADNMKLIHFLLRKRGIRDDWYPEYEDKVQDILCRVLHNIPKYDSERSTKSRYIDLLITEELGYGMTVSRAGRLNNQHISMQDAGGFLPLFEEDITEQIYAEQEFDKLTEVQQMEAQGYSFKEIGIKTGLSPDYLRNKKGLAARSKA